MALGRGAEAAGREVQARRRAGAADGREHDVAGDGLAAAQDDAAGAARRPRRLRAHDVAVLVADRHPNLFQAPRDGAPDVVVDGLAVEQRRLAEDEGDARPQVPEDERVLDADDAAALDEHVLGQAAHAHDRVRVVEPLRRGRVVPGQRRHARPRRTRREEDRGRLERRVAHGDFIRADEGRGTGERLDAALLDERRERGGRLAERATRGVLDVRADVAPGHAAIARRRAELARREAQRLADPARGRRQERAVTRRLDDGHLVAQRRRESSGFASHGPAADDDDVEAPAAQGRQGAAEEHRVVGEVARDAGGGEIGES